MQLLNRLWPTLVRDVILNRILASVLIPMPFRWRAYRAIGMDVEQSRICPTVWFGNRNVSIGAGTFVNYRCVFNTAGGISIGRNCDIAMDVKFITSSHEIGGPARRAGTPTSAPIVVGDGAWIGAGAIILPGVSIGTGAIVAAGSVVTRDCEANFIYAGVPAIKKSVIPPTNTAPAVS